MDWIALVGPTASGKSALAIELAQHVPLEIVSIDSAQVYRGMDIGTAKPTPADRAQVPHHLIDIRDPASPYSAAEFVAATTRLVADIGARGRLPLLVGGTMLYLHAWVHGIDPMPTADAALRERLEDQAHRCGWPAMHARLAAVDPVTAARLSTNDSQRIQRALEVWHSSGRPLSHWHTQHRQRATRTGGRIVALEPRSRGWLHERIERRFDTMVTAGFVDEVRALMLRGDLNASTPSMRCVGYRQAWSLLSEGGGSLDRAALRARGIAATRQLAKRQLTWLRSMQERVVVACDDEPAGALAAVRDAVDAAV
jgi:tRNA dimethylallyltransferase